MTVARIQIAQGQLDEAQPFLEQMLLSAQAGGRTGRVIRISALQAIAAWQQGYIEQALQHLEYALSLGEAEGYIRSFVDKGVAVEALLKQLQTRGIQPAYLSTLLAAFEHPSPATMKPILPQDWVGKQIETLSERELEVVRLLADGASNREIAAQLVVSLGTVKKHLSNIFTKLDAHSRTQVIVVAREKTFSELVLQIHPLKATAHDYCQQTAARA
jgi:LuxR family maltose regulon positive regulatory protein